MTPVLLAFPIGVVAGLRAMLAPGAAFGSDRPAASIEDVVAIGVALGIAWTRGALR